MLTCSPCMASTPTGEMLRTVPALRAYALSLCRDPTRADDLVQETLLRALANIESFQPGTNMSAWLFTILRNRFRSEYRRRRREVEDGDGAYSIDRLEFSAGGEHDEVSRLDCAKMRHCLECLPLDQREALILVGGEGLSYEEAAQACGVPVGTIKSRVNRARGALAAMLEGYQLTWSAREQGSPEEVAVLTRLEQAGVLDDFALEEGW